MSLQRMNFLLINQIIFFPGSSSYPSSRSIPSFCYFQLPFRSINKKNIASRVFCRKINRHFKYIFLQLQYFHSIKKSQICLPFDYITFPYMSRIRSDLHFFYINLFELLHILQFLHNFHFCSVYNPDIMLHSVTLTSMVMLRSICNRFTIIVCAR